MKGKENTTKMTYEQTNFGPTCNIYRMGRHPITYLDKKKKKMDKSQAHHDIMDRQNFLPTHNTCRMGMYPILYVSHTKAYGQETYK